MKILIAGDWHSELHEEAIYRVFDQLGHQPIRFAWHQYFMSAGLLAPLGSLLCRAQRKYLAGPLVSRLNNDLTTLAAAMVPDVIFVYRGSHIFPQTLRRIRAFVPNVLLVGYNNDDPFSSAYPRWQWRHFLNGLPEYDLVLAYRQSNIENLKAAGARQVELLRSWFMPERNHPVHLTEEERRRFECDVVFIGHYEDDGRVECLEEVARSGYRLRIFGPGYDWDPVLSRSKVLTGHVPVQLVWGSEYNLALCGAKVALCFLSKTNNDTYTRRCFEIPASGTVLMSEYSDDLASLYHANREAVYFSSSEEMRAGLFRLLSDEDYRASVALAGTRRVWADHHDVRSRMQFVLGLIEQLRSSQR
ncbi:MAG: hypothetical protein JW395_2085 [Nitrospira sp.]|nr:hypothetical protein [Nitrospira sp.]